MLNSNLLMPLLILIIFTYALFKKVDAYQSFINGCVEGCKNAFKILPYLLSMYIAISIIRSSGLLTDILNFSFLPSSIIIQGMLRPFSNSASLAFMLETFESYGVDSIYGIISSIIQGTSDSSIYIMALYFGSVGITNTKYAFKLGLLINFLSFLLAISLILIL